MSPEFTDDDIGKTVVNANGEEVGIVADVEHGTAHVQPDPGVTDTIKAKLGWGGTDEDAYPLQEGSVAQVTDDQIHLESDLSGSGGGAVSAGDSAGRETGTRTEGARDTEMHDDDDSLIGDDDEGLTDDDDDLIGDDDEGLTDDDDDLIGDDTR